MCCPGVHSARRRRAAGRWRRARGRGKAPAPTQAPIAETEPEPPITRIPQLLRTPRRPAEQQPARHLAFAGPVALIMVAGLVASLYWWMRPEHIALRLFDTAGQLRITWDATARLARNGRAAHLEITDGGEKLWLELAREQLRGGNMAYTRRSANVTGAHGGASRGRGAGRGSGQFRLVPWGRPRVESAQAQLLGLTDSRERVQTPQPLVVEVPVEQAPPEKARPKFAAPRGECRANPNRHRTSGAGTKKLNSAVSRARGTYGFAA